MIERNFSGAMEQFNKMDQQQDAVVQNLLGECHAFLGETDKALSCFMCSLHLQPDYEDPLENLKALGGLSNFMLGDPTWLKFR